MRIVYCRINKLSTDNSHRTSQTMSSLITCPVIDEELSPNWSWSVPCPCLPSVLQCSVLNWSWWNFFWFFFGEFTTIPGKEPPTGTGSSRWRGLNKDHWYRFYPLEWTTGTVGRSESTVDHYKDLILRGRRSTIWKWIRQISRELYFRSSVTIVSCVRSDDVTTQKGSRVRPALHFRRVFHRLCFGGYCCLLWIDEANVRKVFIMNR
jgi:hypothetical protein